MPRVAGWEWAADSTIELSTSGVTGGTGWARVWSASASSANGRTRCAPIPGTCAWIRWRPSRVCTFSREVPPNEPLASKVGTHHLQHRSPRGLPQANDRMGRGAQLPGTQHAPGLHEERRYRVLLSLELRGARN